MFHPSDHSNFLIFVISELRDSDWLLIGHLSHLAIWMSDQETLDKWVVKKESMRESMRESSVRGRTANHSSCSYTVSRAD